MKAKHKKVCFKCFKRRFSYVMSFALKSRNIKKNNNKLPNKYAH